MTGVQTCALPIWLARFPNILVVPVCSAPQTLTTAVMPGRPTDYLPGLVPSDVLYACGAPAMVNAAREDFTGTCGLPPAAFHADAFLTQAETAE